MIVHKLKPGEGVRICDWGNHVADVVLVNLWGPNQRYQPTAVVYPGPHYRPFRVGVWYRTDHRASLGVELLDGSARISTLTREECECLG